MRESGRGSAGSKPPGSRSAAADPAEGSFRRSLSADPAEVRGKRSLSADPTEPCYNRKTPPDAAEVRGNPFQREAICHFTGPCEVLAGPGSGKTFVITERILRLIRYQRMDPSRILVLTFSKAAAMEMRQRFQRRSAPDSYPVTFGTFHSVFYHILQQSTEGETPLSIISEKNQLQLVENMMLRFCHKKPSAEETAAMLSMIAACKATGQFPACRPQPGSEDDPAAHLREILHDYNTYLDENHLVDFEDMIGRCLDLLQSREDILHYWQERFQFLLVDEFQDINAGQFEVLRLLAGHRKNLFVVGDDDQSIYGFRGSDPSFMMKFPAIFPGCRVITLEINYRCRQQIIDLSQKVIHENRQRLDKTVRAAGRGVSARNEGNSTSASRAAEAVSTGRTRETAPNGRNAGNSSDGRSRSGRDGSGSAAVAGYSSQEEEYAWIAGALRAMPLSMQSQCAIIFRTHMQMAGMTRYFDRNGIPYREEAGRRRKSAGSSVLSPETLQLLNVIRGYYRLAQACGTVARRSDLFLVMNCPERFLLRSSFRKPAYTAEELLNLFPRGSAEEGSIRRLLADLQALQRLSPPMSWRWLKRILQTESGTGREHVFIRSGNSEGTSRPSQTKITEGKIRSAQTKIVQGEFTEAQQKIVMGDSRPGQTTIPELEWTLLDQLISEAAEQAASLRAFLAALESEDLPGRLASLLSAREAAAARKKDGVRLITMHACKGLEFEGVFIPDLNEGILPSRRAGNGAGIEEERRLLYVAMTRARSRLFLLYIRGTRENPRRPSRFLEVLGVKPWEQ